MVQLTILHNELEHFDEEHSGFSVLVETHNYKILFDTSFSDDIIKNSEKINFNIKNVDFLVISHGHWDHTNGLKNLINYKLRLVAHPDFFEEKTENGENIGVQISKQELLNFFNLILSKEPYNIDENIIFLGEIPRVTSFEGKTPCGKQNDKDDYLLDDSALVINSDKGLIIISGCSHSGICNIIEYSKKVTKQKKVYAVLGGFHLFNKEIIDKTVNYFKSQRIEHIYPSHCLSDYAFSEFKKLGSKKVVTLQKIEF